MIGNDAEMILRFLSNCLPTPSRMITDMNRLTKRESIVTWCFNDELNIRVRA